MKPFLLILAIAALTMAGLFYYKQQPLKTEASRPVAVASVPTASLPKAPRAAVPSLAEVDAYREQSRVRKIESDAKSAEIAATMTPAFAEKSLNRLMAHWEPDYRKMFSTWNLDEQKAQQVLSIIRERQKNLLEDMIRGMRDGPAERGDHSDTERTSASYKKAISKQESAKLIAEQELAITLGPERAQQLREMEEQRLATTRKSAAAEAAD